MRQKSAGMPGFARQQDGRCEDLLLEGVIAGRLQQYMHTRTILF